jgi:23S rRNA pseudouridine2605 synthase
VPPRYAYWTILIDDKPTAFRAREREELLPTFVQLQRKNTNVAMQWFARGQLWASREAERDDFQMRKQAASAPRDRGADRPEGAERRGSDWRPGGTHKDPRDRFKKKNRPERAWSEKDPATQRDRDKPGFVSSAPREPRRPSSASRASGGGWRDKPAGPPRGDRPWSNKPGGGGKRPWTGKPRQKSDVAQGFPPPPAGDSRGLRRGSPNKPWNDKPAGGAPPGDRPWQTKPTGPRAQRKPWSNKPSGDAPRGDRPWSGKPGGAGKRPWSEKPRDKSDGARGPGKSGVAQGFPPPPAGDSRGLRRGSPNKPWSDKPAGGPPRGDRPWSNKPPGGAPRGERKPWQNKPSGGDGKPFRPRTGPPRNGPRKKRDDEPPDRG